MCKTTNFQTWKIMTSRIWRCGVVPTSELFVVNTINDCRDPYLTKPVSVSWNVTRVQNTLVRLVRSRFPNRNEKKLSFFIVLEPPLESFSRSNNAWHFITRWKVHGFWASFWVSRFHRDSLCPHQIQGESLHMASSLRLQLPQENTRRVWELNLFSGVTEQKVGKLQ